MHTGFRGGNVRKKENHLENLGVDGMILRWICTKYDRGVGRIDLVQYMNTWQVITNATMDFRVS